MKTNDLELLDSLSFLLETLSTCPNCTSCREMAESMKWMLSEEKKSLEINIGKKKEGEGLTEQRA